MKKNISINISDIIFHIEEDGYDTLRKYLDSINSYFRSFEDSSEILADIESRIAEIFLSKLNEGKQIITLEDVQSLTATMGSVNDFKAAEAQEESEKPGAAQQETSDEPAPAPSARQQKGGKRLLRDQRRKILGGVCAGLGNYFSIDPVWARVLFALAAVGTYGIFIAVYLVLWIALPHSNDLDEESSVKKMFRDPDQKVIGGVAAGIAAFFGVETVVIRVIFVISAFFFGTGILLYIVLWAVLPEAKTITDKMKMQGEPVTLSNIESSVKKSLNEKDETDESTLAKIVLFPFRIIAAIIQAIGRFLGPVFNLLIEILRVGIGLIFSFTGVAFIITLVMITGVLLGLFNFSTLHFGDFHLNGNTFPMEAMRRAFPTWTVLFAFFGTLIPAVVILLIGNSIIAKRNLINGITAWSLFIVFFICVAFLSIRIPQIVYTFKEQGEVKVDKIFTTGSRLTVLKLKETGMDDYDFTRLAINGYDGKDLKLVERFGAQGISRLNARENAQQIVYNVSQQDSVITFDSNLAFKPEARFSFQRLDLDLMVPYGMPFAIDPEMWHFIQNRWRYDFPSNDEVQTYKFMLDEKTQESKMICVTCPPAPKDMSAFGTNDQFGLKDFTEIDLTGAFIVNIRHGDHYSIQLEGSDVRKKQYALEVVGETLEINYSNHDKSFWKNTFNDDDLVTLNIELPQLEKLKVTGAGKIKIIGFHEQETKLSMTGAMTVDARISADQLYIDLTGPVIFELDGDGNFLEANITGAAQLKASSFTANHAIIEATGMAQARVNVNQRLEIDRDMTSSVKYTGSPEVVNKD